MGLAKQLDEGIGSNVFYEEREILERSGNSSADLAVAMDMLSSVMSKAYPGAKRAEIEGIVTHFVGLAMREARTLDKKGQARSSAFNAA